jgi:ComF family protein
MASFAAFWKRYPADFLSLLFPERCPACSCPMQNGERFICTACHYSLPQTGSHLNPDHPVSRIFWGRVRLESVAALYTFQKGGGVQHLIHQLKYKGRKEIGYEAGRLLGVHLKEVHPFNTCDYVIPVPLHIARERKRGYNQSEYFARGLGSSLKIPVDTAVLRREERSETQTRKNRFNRWKNVESVFRIHTAASLAGKHILLADDVVTTGATLEACVNTLQKAAPVKVSIAVMAMANS